MLFYNALMGTNLCSNKKIEKLLETILELRTTILKKKTQQYGALPIFCLLPWIVIENPAHSFLQPFGALSNCTQKVDKSSEHVLRYYGQSFTKEPVGLTQGPKYRNLKIFIS